VSVAHDDRLARPGWLVRQFQPTETRLVVGGQAMTLFERRSTRDESLTLGANAGDSRAAAGNMYIVFVQGTGPPQ
jgi:beta-galactosidase